MFSDRNLICKPNLQISIGRFYSTRMLSISSASIWIFLLAVSSRPIDFGRGIKNAPSASLRCLLKKSFESFAISPSFAGLLGPRCGLLHTRVGASRCHWSAPGLPPSDWWRTPSTCRCLYLAGETQVACVHIVVHTTSFLIV